MGHNTSRGDACPTPRFDYNNLQQGLGYLMSLLFPDKKDMYLQPIRDVMDLWLNERSNITYTPKVGGYVCDWRAACPMLRALPHRRRGHLR